MEKKYLEQLKERIITKGKKAAVAVSLVAALSSTGCMKDKSDKQTIEPTTTIETTTEITTEEIVTVDRIDQIIDEYNNMTGSNLSRMNLGAVEYGYGQCMYLYEDTSTNKYVYDSSLGYNKPESYQYVDSDDISKMYVLINNNTDEAIAALAKVNGNIENVYIQCYRTDDNNYANPNRYITLNTSDYEALSEYYIERCERKSLK